MLQDSITQHRFYFTTVWYQTMGDQICAMYAPPHKHIHTAPPRPPPPPPLPPLLHLSISLGTSSTHQGSGLSAWGMAGAEKAFACWQQQQQRHSDTSLQQAGRTRLNPAGSRVCRETHWPGIWDVRLTLLNDSLETMSIRATPSSLFDIKAKEGGWRRNKAAGGGEEWLEKEAKLHSSDSQSSKYQGGCECRMRMSKSAWVRRLSQTAPVLQRLTWATTQYRGLTEKLRRLAVRGCGFTKKLLLWTWATVVTVKASWRWKMTLRSVYIYIFITDALSVFALLFK